MSQEWMLDLITDLRRVAEKSAMYELMEQLDDTLLIAASEIRLADQAAGACGTDGVGECVPGKARTYEIS